MAKLSARGATVLVRFATPDGGQQMAVRSDGAVLYKVRYSDGSWSGWSTLMRFPKPKDAKAEAICAYLGRRYTGLKRIKT